MKLTLKDLCTLLSDEDPTDILELLDLSTEELIEAFKPKVRERISYLRKYYETYNEEKTPFRGNNECLGLGSKEAWENAGFDLQDEGWQ